MSSVNAYVQSFRISAVTAAILQAATNASPGKELFRDVVIGGRPLGDINNTGTVTSADALDYLRWGQGTLADPGFTYVETVLNPYMTQNPVAYAAYLAFGYGQVGSVTMTGDANVTLTGVVGTGEVGSVVREVPVTGVSGNGQVGSVTLTASANVFPAGLVALGQVKPALVWGPVDDSQNANWAPVDDGQSAAWTPVNDTSNPNWQPI
jgi:hypothetical protein